MNTALSGSFVLSAISLFALTASPSTAAVAGGFPSATPQSVGRAAGLQVVPGHVRPEIARAPIIGSLSPSTVLHLSIGLPLRNRAAASTLAAAVSNPRSPFYHRYLTPAQYQARFSPSLSDYESVIAFAQASHFAVTRTFANRVVIDADASVTAIQQAFHVTIQTRRRSDGSIFYAPSNEPALALQTAVLHIAGLDNFIIARPQIASLAPLTRGYASNRHANPDLGSGPGNTYAGPDFRNAYARGATQSGSGQCIGLLEFDSTFFPSDIAAYQSAFSLPPIFPQVVLLDGYGGVPVVSKGEQETALDIEVSQAMAPSMFGIVVFEGSNADDIFSAMVSPPGVPLCNQLSASWNFGVDSTAQQLVEQMALQGQSFFVSSGDGGGFTSDTNDDRDLSDTTVVGGTILQLDDNFRWLSETGWPGSGGGIENNEYVPPFQQGLKIGDRGATSKFRMIPDVAMVAANTYLLADHGKAYKVAGTSISTPLWAGYTALVNQQAASVGQPPMGFADPALYAVARSALYSANFHDVTTGSNGPFNAQPGYDLVTGFGSPKATLITTLNPSPTLNYTQLQIVVYTGNDDLRADSDLQISFKGIANLKPFCLMRSNNGSPSGVCTGNVYGDKNGMQGWGGWSTQVLTYKNRFANWTWSGSGTIKLTMTTHDAWPESDDDWDIQAMSVVLSNPATSSSVTLFNTGNFSAPHISGNCYWRFIPGPSGSVSATFKLLPGTTPGNGCPGD